MMKKKFGRYEVRSKLGGGGMGVVFLAYDPRLGREVAVKVIGGVLSDKDQSRQRFYREAQVMASLNHAAIVPIYDFGEQDQQPYLVMRLMRGGSLTELLHKKGRFTLAEVTLMFERLAPALSMAHGRGMVHRDLKPDNILLDQFGYPAITDFGIVKLLNASMPTKTGRVMGTPHCMSPEQGRGEKVIDHRTDIYALGVVLFKLLTDQWPYEADNPLGFVYLHNMEQIPNICDLNPALPPQCQAVIERALAKQPEGRYNSMGEFVHALKALSVVKPVASAVDHIKLGHEAYRQTNYELAILEYGEALRLLPTDTNTYVSRGNAYYQSGEYGLAIADYDHALRITPNYVAPHYWRGRAKQEQGKLKEAIQNYEEALRINPKFVGAYYQRGVAQQQMGQLDLARADYESALRINPNYGKAKTALQALTQQIEQIKEAREREEARKREETCQREEARKLAEASQREEERKEEERKREEARKREKARQLAEARQRQEERKRKEEARKREEASQREEERVKALLTDEAALKRLPSAERVKIYVNLFRNESLQRAVPVKRRAAMGMELAKLGDWRPEVVTINGMEFCLVPAGWFWMGSHDERHKVEIAYPYWVARYPVTNAQFQPFVEEGYRDPVYWTQAEAQGQWKDGKINGRDAPRDYGAPYNLPNHPRVGINWYEALAFTRWLAIRKQWSGARLLSEAEWEKAARGGGEIPGTPLIRPATNLTPLSGLRMISNPFAQRSYPWGDSFDANLTNSEESAIGHINAVGGFAMAKSPYGCEEMSGNVWEWCQSQYKNDEYRPDDGRERLDVYAVRVLRGGAYYSNNISLRCFSRGGSDPHYWSSSRAFRVFRPYKIQTMHSMTSGL